MPPLGTDNALFFNGFTSYLRLTPRYPASNFPQTRNANETAAMSTRPRKQRSGPSPATRLAHGERPARSPLEIRFRVDFDDLCSVGVGKIRLLEAIARTGSLSQAARDIAMSYRRAWLLIDSMNADFDTPVISATVGGSGGGGAQLTSFGREIIAAYRELESRLAPLTGDYMGKFATRTLGRRSGAGSLPSRRKIARSLKRTGRIQKT